MIEAKDITRTFVSGDVTTHVLKGISLRVDSGEFVSIMGRSGAGKSTLMYQLSLLDDPSTGEVLVNGRETKDLSQQQKSRLRLTEFGYVFQDYALLPDLTAVENVAIALMMQGDSKRVAQGKARQALALVGLDHRFSNLPSQLSGGEQQRVSIARAVAHEPKVLFADEPTANLDTFSSGVVIDIFEKLNANGQTIIMVTHEAEYARRAKRLITMEDGLVRTDEPLLKEDAQ